MMTFAARRWLAGIIGTLVTAAIVAVLWSSSLSIHHTADLSGWLLLATLLFLASYNLRKQMPYPPLIKSSTWLQFHIYVGLLSILLFVCHTGIRLPNGPLETVMAALYACVAITGIIGLMLSRIIPSRLAVRGPEVLYERIPSFRRQLRKQAEQLAVDSVQETNLTTLSDFYAKRLADYFRGPRDYWRHLFQSSRPRHEIVSSLRSLNRYLNDQERRIADKLEELIENKDTLDYHHAMQGTLKGWLFVHIPLTYALLLFVAVHVWLVHAFFGGIR